MGEKGSETIRQTAELHGKLQTTKPRQHKDFWLVRVATSVNDNQPFYFARLNENNYSIQLWIQARFSPVEGDTTFSQFPKDRVACESSVV